MSRQFSAHLRQSSVGPGFFSGLAQPSGNLVTRINEKKIELENLKQLRDLSANLASQLRELESKVGTLTNGTEAIAVVLANWHNVLRAISMAAARVPVPNPQVEDDISADDAAQGELPQMLVRVPTQSALAADQGQDSRSAIENNTYGQQEDE